MITNWGNKKKLDWIFKNSYLYPMTIALLNDRADSRLARSRWEMTLQSNAVSQNQISHWTHSIHLDSTEENNFLQELFLPRLEMKHYPIHATQLPEHDSKPIVSCPMTPDEALVP